MKKYFTIRRSDYKNILTRAIGFAAILLILLPAYGAFMFSPSMVWAQSSVTLTDPNYVNPNSEGFRIVVCDGPEGGGHINPATKSIDLSKNSDGSYKYPLTPGYVPCDFNGIMLQVQHLINIAVVGGVLAAIVGFVYAGALYMTGVEKNISKAKSIFPKVATGFIIMLSAWFIVYQILSWLTGSNSGFTVLLGQ